MTSKIHHLGDHLDNNTNNNKVWFTRTIFIWQVFFDKFYLPVRTGKIAVFSLVKFTCLKSRKNLPRKNLPNETCQMKLVELRNLLVWTRTRTSFFLTNFIWQFFIWQVLFACVEGQNCQFFPCHVNLSKEQVNWWIVRTSEQAETGNGSRKQIQQHQGHRSLKRSSRPSWLDCSDWSFLLWLEQCKGGGRTTQLLFFLKTWGPKNRFGTSKSRLMETNQRKTRISRSYLKRPRMWHRKVSTQKRSNVIIIQIDKFYWFKNFLKSSFLKILLSISFVQRGVYHDQWKII